MFSVGFYARTRSVFLWKGRLPLSCAGLRATSSQLPVPTRVKIPQTDHLALVTKRQISIKQKPPLQLSQNNWDKVSSDFDLVYENSLKNWIWGFYIAQSVIAAGCSFLAVYQLPDLLNMLSERDAQLLIACCGLFLASFAFYNFVARRFFIRIYYNSQSGLFTAVRRTCLGRLQKFVYAPSNVTIYDQKIDDGDMKITIKVQGKKFLLQSDEFKSPIYFNMHFYNAGHRQ